MTDEQTTSQAEEPKDNGGNRPRIRMRHFSRSLPMLLLRARESVMRHFRTNLRQYDITEQQWRILRALMSVSEIEVTDLARATFLLGPSLSRILKDLEARGLIERRPDAQDLRRARILISPAGIELIEQVSPQSELIYQEITAAFGADRLRELQVLLEELEAAMNDLSLSKAAAADGSDETD